METLFDIAAFERAGFKHESERPLHFCRTCEHQDRGSAEAKSLKEMLKEASEEVEKAKHYIESINIKIPTNE